MAGSQDIRVFRVAAVIAFGFPVLHGQDIAQVKDFNLRYFGSDTVISLHTNLAFDGKGEHLIATGKNETGGQILHAKICISSASIKGGCLFEVWNPGTWEAGAELTWDVTARKKVRDLTHDATIEDFEGPRSAESVAPPVPHPPSRFDPIHKIYVEELGGNTGPILRDQIIAALVNSGRFLAVEKPDTADAFIRGRSDSQDESTKVTSDGKSSAGAIFGTVIARGKSTSVTEKVVSEKVSLRLTVASGEAIWAWDGTTPCSQTQARCAVQDLTASADRPRR